MKPGTVYVLMSGEFCKIGITRKSVESRASNLGTGNPNGITVEWTTIAKDPEEVESFAHQMLEKRNLRVSGEWFKCPSSIAIAACAGAKFALENAMNVEVDSSHNVIGEARAESATSPQEQTL